MLAQRSHLLGSCYVAVLLSCMDVECALIPDESVVYFDWTVDIGLQAQNHPTLGALSSCDQCQNFPRTPNTATPPEGQQEGFASQDIENIAPVYNIHHPTSANLQAYQRAAHQKYPSASRPEENIYNSSPGLTTSDMSAGSDTSIARDQSTFADQSITSTKNLNSPCNTHERLRNLNIGRVSEEILRKSTRTLQKKEQDISKLGLGTSQIEFPEFKEKSTQFTLRPSLFNFKRIADKAGKFDSNVFLNLRQQDQEKIENPHLLPSHQQNLLSGIDFSMKKTSNKNIPFKTVDYGNKNGINYAQASSTERMKFDSSKIGQKIQSSSKYENEFSMDEDGVEENLNKQGNHGRSKFFDLFVERISGSRLEKPLVWNMDSHKLIEKSWDKCKNIVFDFEAFEPCMLPKEWKDPLILNEIKESINKHPEKRLELSINPDKVRVIHLQKDCKTESIEKKHSSMGSNTRQKRLRNCIHNITNYMPLWLKYWKNNFGLELGINEGVNIIQYSHSQKINAIFIFYVEMILKTIPHGMKKNTMSSISDDLKQALDIFRKFQENRMDKLLQEKKTYSRYLNRRIRTEYPSEVWIYLLAWLSRTTREDLRKIKPKISNIDGFKSTMNDIFCYSISNLRKKIGS